MTLSLEFLAYTQQGHKMAHIHDFYVGEKGYKLLSIVRMDN